MADDNEEKLAGLIGLGLGASVAFAVAELLMSSADSWSTSSLAAGRHNNHAAMLELAACATSVEQLLSRGPPTKKSTKPTPSALEQQIAAMSVGQPMF